jgi:methylglutamate dehydrogenase subunit C
VLKGVVADVKGSRHVAGVEIVGEGGTQRLACDFLAVSGGWNPAVHLACHRGARPAFDDKLACFLPPETGPALRAIGAAAGRFTLSDCLKDGAETGAKAAADCGFEGTAPDIPQVRDEPPFAITPLWWVKQSKSKAFVDLQNDVTAKDLPLAAREGYSDVEQTKRYTTLGMATDQGKLSNVNGLAILAEATGRTIAQVGTTTFRPFYTPVSMGALTGPYRGKHFQPVRKTALHDWSAGTGRRVRRGRTLVPRPVVPATRRDRLARKRHPRGADGARARRRLRRLHPRQDRRPGP